ncbi:AraC family transcriptional regulator [Actinoplanes sp. OR16]|uniref:GlxA family transcriptional regulator n=1 Tax=Actinoplanes sp. OR16 TaxID=946334 RepID=UPI000F702CEF|nr:helix-turn-helix domain-containing protein [Actinoplanes sp. OR16]BBH69487.1 AraC family transcriptional regulator [Actinoplanes sp. OR16]
MTSHVVAVALTDGLPIFELSVPFEVFGNDRSDIVSPWYDLRLCSEDQRPLRTTGGLTVTPEHDLGALAAAGTVLIPALPRAGQIAPPPALVDAVRTAYDAGKRIVSICTGAYVLAAAGLLDGRPATTHWMNAHDLAHRYPAVKVDASVLYVDDGQVLTSAGTAAAIDLCLHLVRRDHGTAVANEVARRMVTPPHREGGQAQFVRPVQPGGERGDLGPVLEWARRRLDQPLAVADLAGRAHLSPRTFARRFREEIGVTPLQWILEQRVRLAQELLETTDEPIERVARRAGFGTGAGLRQHFGRVLGISPQSYRHVFRHRAAAALS